MYRDQVHRARRAAPASDEVLLQRAARDPAAFADVYRRHRPAIERWLRRVTGDPHVAGELSSETFAEALASAAHYDPAKGPAAAWLYGIARNRWMMWLRDGAIGERALLRAAVREGDSSVHEETEAIDEKLSRPWPAAAVRTALERLSPALREAVLLRVVGDLSHAEIATLLGISDGTARVRVLRGLRQLADALGAADAQG